MARIWAGFLVALTMAGFTPAFAESAQAETCQLMRNASFDIPREDVVTIPVDVDGTQEQFLVDTGGVISSIGSSVVDALHLEAHTIKNGTEIYAGDGTLIDHYAQIDKLGIGQTYAKDYTLLVEPQHTRTGLENFAGTLAPDLLENFDLDFDFGQNKLNLFSPEHCEGHVVYWATAFGTVAFDLDTAGHVRATVTLDGHEYSALFDTGASHSLLSAHLAAWDFGLTPGSPGLEKVPGATAQSLVPYFHQFKSLTVGDVTVSNPQIGILQDAMEQGFRRRHESGADLDPVEGPSIDAPQVVLGMDVLRRLHLYIAYGEKTLYVTAADAGLPATPTAAPPVATK